MHIRALAGCEARDRIAFAKRQLGACKLIFDLDAADRHVARVRHGDGIRYDEPTPGADRFAGKDHYHILNPNATGSRDMYLVRNGEPVKKNSKASHILPKGEK